MTKLRTRILIGPALALVLVGAVPPAARADGGTGLAFVGVANLPEFPCTPDPGEPACTGDFGGSISGELAGDKLGSVWTATLADGSIDADFTYNDAEGHCATGVATGTATVIAGAGHVVGTYDRGDILPRQVLGLWAQVDFTWDRVGPTAALTLGNGRVRLNVFGIGWIQVMTDSVGAAAATFVPEFDPDNLPDCVEFTNNPPLGATVVGIATLADPT